MADDLFGSFDSVVNQISNKPKANDKKTYEFDLLAMYYCEPYVLNDFITIHQPTIEEIIRYRDKTGTLRGEKGFYSMINPFVTNPTSCRVALWKAGIDWCKTSDFELFIMNLGGLDNISPLFHGFSFEGFEGYKRKKPIEKEDGEIEYKEELVLIDEKRNLEIDEETYSHLSAYCRTMFNIFPKVEKARGKNVKQSIIDEEIREINNKKDENKSNLLSLISSALCHGGFKYNKEELRKVGIFEFMYDIQRLQIYEQSTALLKGAYSGFVDASKINNEEMNFMRDIKL